MMEEREQRPSARVVMKQKEQTSSAKVVMREREQRPSAWMVTKVREQRPSVLVVMNERREPRTATLRKVRRVSTTAQEKNSPEVAHRGQSSPLCWISFNGIQCR